MQKNIRLYPWYQAFRSLLFWQGIWFLYLQQELSAGEAILLIAIFDVASALLEVPSGYFSDKFGRRLTLIIGLVAMMCGCLFIGLSGSFVGMALGQVLLGAGIAFNSGTDNALLYDSLLAAGEQDDVARHEVRAWRFNFTALAVSAFVGGFIALYSMAATFLLTSVAALLGLWVAWQFREPEADGQRATLPLAERLSILRGYLHQPALAWLFYLAVAMYIFSHVPFVFGQPFIDQVLQRIGSADVTTAVSGTITSLMMLVSVAAGWWALPIGNRLGVAGILLLAFGMQVGLITVLMLSVHPIAMAFLLLRMVPNAFAQPFILANIQPRIDSTNRATYLSLQSLCGRLGLGMTLFVGATLVDGTHSLSHATLQWVLAVYVVAGVAIWVTLLLTSHRISADDRSQDLSTKT